MRFVFLFISISLLILPGCAYDRTFMQMDSNSPSPFFGLQWSVDSGTRGSAVRPKSSESLKWREALPHGHRQSRPEFATTEASVIATAIH
jgi:hypothetical protein